MESRDNEAPANGPVPPAQIAEVEDWHLLPDEVKAYQTVEVHRQVWGHSASEYPEGDIQREVRKGLYHCFSNYYTASDMVRYMSTHHGLEVSLSKLLFQKFVSSPGGKSYLRHSAKLKRGEASNVANLSDCYNIEQSQSLSRDLPTQFSAMKEAMEQVEPTELSMLISEMKYEDAFQLALNKQDVSIVAYLCTKVEPLLTKKPLPLNQSIILSLIQQLAYDIQKDTSRKLAWIAHVVTEINPSDQTINPHAREKYLKQVQQVLLHQLNAPGTHDVSAIGQIVDVIDSKLNGCN